MLIDPRSQTNNELRASLSHHRPRQHHRRSLPSLECNSIRHTARPHLSSSCVSATEATKKQITASENTSRPLGTTKSIEQPKHTKNLVLPLAKDLNNLPSLSDEHTQPTPDCTRHQATIGQQRVISIGVQARATYNKLLSSAHRELSPSPIRHPLHRTIIVSVLFLSRWVYRPPSRPPEHTVPKNSQTTNTRGHPGGSTGVTCNDPSTPPPTETLLRLLLPLNYQQDQPSSPGWSLPTSLG